MKSVPIINYNYIITLLFRWVGRYTNNYVVTHSDGLMLIHPIGIIYTKLFNINHVIYIYIYILIRNNNMYDVWIHVIQSIIKLHTVVFRI